MEKIIKINAKNGYPDFELCLSYPKDLSKGILFVIKGYNDERSVCENIEIFKDFIIVEMPERLLEADRLDVYLEAVSDSIKEIRKKYRYTPIVMLGVGIGGNILRLFIEKYPDAPNGAMFERTYEDKYSFFKKARLKKRSNITSELGRSPISENLLANVLSEYKEIRYDPDYVQYPVALPTFIYVDKALPATKTKGHIINQLLDIECGNYHYIDENADVNESLENFMTRVVEGIWMMNSTANFIFDPNAKRPGEDDDE